MVETWLWSSFEILLIKIFFFVGFFFRCCGNYYFFYNVNFEIIIGFIRIAFFVGYPLNWFFRIIFVFQLSLYPILCSPTFTSALRWALFGDEWSKGWIQGLVANWCYSFLLWWLSKSKRKKIMLKFFLQYFDFIFVSK